MGKKLLANEDIKQINGYLKEGKSVAEVRKILGIGEKSFQRQIKQLNYKYNQKIKQYEPLGELPEAQLIKSSDTTTQPTTKATTQSTTLTTTETTTIKYLTDNIDLLKQLLENYKKATTSDNKDIVINLVNDKHLKPKPKSIRINEFVWQDWLTYTKDLTFSKSDLISQALIEFMQNHKD